MYFRKRLSIVAGAAALAVVAATAPAAGALAATGGAHPASGAAKSGVPARGAPARAARLPRPTAHAPAFRAGQGVTSCSYLKAHLAQLARAGRRRAACLQPAHPLTKKVARPGRQHPVAGAAPGGVRRAAPLAQTDCDGQPSGQWVLLDRTAACLQQNLSYYVWNPADGTLLAGATITTNEEIELNTTFWDWDEDVYATMTNPFGNTALLNTEVAWVPGCGAPCYPQEASAFDGNWVYLSPGVTVDGGLTFDADVPTDGAVSMPQGDELIVYNGASANQYATAGWSVPYAVRCDDQVAGDGGCVFPAFTPNLTLPESQYGAAAATILWAQVNQDGVGLPYGAGPPLHRLADAGQASANRNVICDGTFTPDPNIANDSCDEFPFASSYESGAMNGYTGAECAEVEPVFDGSGWTVNDLNGIVDSGCTRGHVPLSQNQAVGGALGSFVSANRLLDGDAYTIQVTAN
jgi:hypothetical protein